MYAILSKNKEFCEFKKVNNAIESDERKVVYENIKLDSDIYISITGIIFYYLERGVKKRFQKSEFQSICHDLYKYKGIRFIFDLEGEFSGYIRDKNSNSYYIFSDAFSRRQVYYIHIKTQELLVSDNIWEIIKYKKENDITINNNAARSFLIKGYIPAGFTLFKEIFRIRPGFILKFSTRNNVLSALDSRKIFRTHDYNKKELQYYERLLEEAIEFRKSKKNIVYISGGLDSAVLLGILLKKKENEVSAAIWEILSNGELINSNEIFKAKNLCGHYGISLKVRKLDYSKINFVTHFQLMIAQGMTEFFHLGKSFHYMFKKDNFSDISIFLGQQSNSIHNFRLTGGSIGKFPYFLNLQNYPAKLWNYLWSPAFLRKIKYLNFKNDFFFQLLKTYMRFRGFNELDIKIKNQYDSKEFLYEYFASFLLAGNLLPFNKEKNEFSFLLDDTAKDDFLRWLYTNFFEDLIPKYSDSSHYSILTKIDRDFHLQGSDSAVIYYPAKSLNSIISMPYDDIKLVEFIEQMPEDWGRSFELRRPRFPLIQVGKKIKLPFHKINYTPYREFSEVDLYKAVMTGKTKSHIQSLFEDILNTKMYKEIWTKSENLKIRKLLNEFINEDKYQIGSALLHRTSYLHLILLKYQEIL